MTATTTSTNITVRRRSAAADPAVADRMRLYTDCVSSPIGPLQLLSDGELLRGLYMAEHRGGPTPIDLMNCRRDGAPFADVKRELEAYFAGTLVEFTTPFSPPAGTPFQRAVWTALSDIPFGATVTYREIARRVGRPTAMRAVGAANGRNPISIIVPCHRVIGAGGSLTGYGGGLDRKQWLLEHEQRHAPAPTGHPREQNVK